MGNFVTPQKILAVQNFVGIFQKFLDFFSSNSEKNIIFRARFSRKILLNDYDFWQFSINPWYMRVYGKLRKLKKMSFKGLEKRVRNISTDVAILRCWRGCEWRWIWIEMILWLCGINVFFFSFHKQLKSLVPNPEMCKMRQKIIASMP